MSKNPGKKGFFERVGLVERVPAESSETPGSYEDENVIGYEEAEVEVNTEGVSANTLIKDLYFENHLDDLSKSIFKIEEIDKTLPKTIPTDAKRETVKGILSSFQIGVDEVVEDANTRMSVIRSACNQMCNHETDEIKRLETEVENLYQEAEMKKKEIQERNATLNNIINTSQQEITRIKGLMDFITDNKVGEEE